MFELKGKYLSSRFYARKIPLISGYVYEMSYVKKSSFFYKTTPFPTRLIDLQSDFESGYSKRLGYHFRKSEEAGLEIRRPDWVPDLREMYEPIKEHKGLNPLPEEALKIKPHYHYSSIHHPTLGRLVVHLNIADEENLRVFQFINASAYRSFTESVDQQLCSSANKYLYHHDMLYFKSLGYRYFDHVGTSEPMNQLKKQFGGEIVMTYTHVPYPIHWLKKLKKGLSRGK